MVIGRAGIICHTNDDDILLVLSGTPSKLGLPKGHKEDNEDLWSCAMRETREETGICFNHYDEVWISDDIQFFIVHEDIDHTQLIQADSDEIADVKLLPYKDILEFKNTAFINKSLRNYLNFKEKTVKD